MHRDDSARLDERERAALKLAALRAHLSIARGRELALDLDAFYASLLVRVERRFGVRVDDLGAGERPGPRLADALHAVDQAPRNVHRAAPLRETLREHCRDLPIHLRRDAEEIRVRASERDAEPVSVNGSIERGVDPRALDLRARAP